VGGRCNLELPVKRSFWKDKQVLVTGHSGFKGGWLSLWLQRLGAEVSGLSLSPVTEPSLFEGARVEEGMRSVIGDIRDPEVVESVVREARPAIVLHLAAQALVREGYSDPVGTYATNVLGTINVLEAVRRSSNARVVLVITSDKCYENREWHWGYREADRLGGHDPYSSSKACTELATAAYRDSFFRNEGTAALASARSGNVIGGGDWARDRLIPDLIRGALDAEQVLIRSPHAVRPWQHVLEPLRGYLMLAERLWAEDDRFASAWNFGPSEQDARSVGWMADHLSSLWGEGADWRIDEGTHPHEATLLRLDCSKGRHELGWVPRLDLEHALEWTVEWYHGYRDGGDQRRLIDSQLERYEEIIDPR
jgi:CDP-glucose 4,6-dehydratase